MFPSGKNNTFHYIKLEKLKESFVNLTFTELLPYIFVCLFVDRISLYSPGCPGTHFVEQAEQARGGKLVMNIPPWPLHQLLLPDLLEFQS